MQISFDFEELYDSLSKVAEVSCDGMLDMAQRNFTIKTQGPEITLIGLNQQVLYHKQMTGKNLVDGVGIPIVTKPQKEANTEASSETTPTAQTEGIAQTEGTEQPTVAEPFSVDNVVQAQTQNLSSGSMSNTPSTEGAPIAEASTESFGINTVAQPQGTVPVIAPTVSAPTLTPTVEQSMPTVQPSVPTVETQNPASTQGTEASSTPNTQTSTPSTQPQAEPKYILLSCKPVLDYLATYRNDTLLEVTGLTLTTDDNSPNATIQVTTKDTNTNKITNSKWAFAKLAISANHIHNITKTPIDSATISTLKTEAIQKYTETILPKMETGVGVYSKANFGTDYVVVFNKAHTTFIKNDIASSISGIALYHKGIQFIDKVMCEGETLNVAIKDNMLYINNEDSEAYIRCETKLPDYQRYTQIYNQQHNISVNKSYMLRALKRSLLLKDEPVLFSLANSEVALNNTKLKQSIPVNSEQDMALMDKKIVKILPEVIDKAILTNMSESDVLNICIVEIKGAMILFCFYDDTDTWFTSINTKLVDA